MKLITLISLFLIQKVSSQSASCEYFTTADSYMCVLTLINPNGFDNFTQISGDHVSGYSDNDVQLIYRGFGSNSTNIPSIICQQFNNIERMEFDRISIERIDENSFKNCRNLRQLHLNGNSISEIAENAFVENSNLEVLNLNSNELEKLPVKMFSSQSKLRDLFLSSNGIEILPDGIFDYLVNVKVILLMSNKLMELPANIFDYAVNLVELDLSFNQIKTLNSILFMKSTKLATLHLNNNQLTDLPQNIFMSTNLNVLSIYDNQIAVIHEDSFGNQPNLEQFYFLINGLLAFDEKLIDNSGVQYMIAGPNPCVTQDGFIIDETESRSVIRAALQNCFDNYDEFARETCEIGNLDDRVCSLEDEKIEMRVEIKELRDENSKLQTKIENLEKSVETLRDEFVQKFKYLEDQIQQLIPQ